MAYPIVYSNQYCNMNVKHRGIVEAWRERIDFGINWNLKCFVNLFSKNHIPQIYGRLRKRCNLCCVSDNMFWKIRTCGTRMIKCSRVKVTVKVQTRYAPYFVQNFQSFTLQNYIGGRTEAVPWMLLSSVRELENVEEVHFELKLINPIFFFI